MQYKDYLSTSDTPAQEQQQPQQQANMQGGTTTTPTATPTTPATTQTATPAATTPAYSGYDDIYNSLQKKIDEARAKQETDAQRKKRERLEKWEGIISGISDMGMAISNLVATSQYAPNAYTGQDSMSEKAKERWEKAKAEREKADADQINYMLQMAKLKDADRDYQNKIGEQQRQQNNWELTFNAGRADRAADVQFHEERAKKADDQWQQQFDYNKKRDKLYGAGSSRGGNSGGSGTGSSGATGRKKFGTGISVKQSNWNNDDYIEQLYSHLNMNRTYKGSDGKVHHVSGGARNLFENTNEKTQDRELDRKTRINLMRGALEELFSAGYDSIAQETLGAFMEDFDERYSSK